MLGSAERTSSSATNKQVFYYTNIAPQLSSGFNTGGGGWNLLEDWVDTQVCADTLYEVVGCYFDKYTDAYGYTVLTYFYGGLLLAAAVFVYFNFMDNGYLMSKLTDMLNTEEGRQVVKLYGMADEISQSMEELAKMRPIDYAVNMLTVIISTGFILGLPTAALMKRELKIEN